MQRLRVGFLSSQNYLDKNAWSGTVYYMHQALSATDLQVINLGEPYKPSRWRSLLNRLRKKNAPAKIGSPEYAAEHSQFAGKVQKQLLENPCDVIFAPVASAEVTFLETSIPIIYLSDTTLRLYHQLYSLNLDSQEFLWADKQESTAIAKASRLVYSSEWAARSAIDDYQAKAEKVAVIPFGANLDAPPLVGEVLSKKATSPCRLLFVGKDWHRKNGETAFQTLIALLEKGIDAELMVVGCVPPPEFEHEKLTVIPYLNKNVFQERQQLDELFLNSHFLIFPTRADCSPIVICEANAFGLPVITSEVGGIPTLIKNGKNGYMLPLSASGGDYAHLIAETFSHQTNYARLVRSSREEYDRRLNWNNWANSLSRTIESVLDKETSQTASRAIAMAYK